VLALATAGGSGFAPFAPGTFGSAFAVLLFVPLAALGSFGYGLVTLVLFAVGVPASSAAEKIFRKSDDGRIVIDEVVGQLITLLPLVVVPLDTGLPRYGLLAAGFTLFRLFDIWKPGPVRVLERRVHRGLGVMLDDVAAGVLAAIALSLLILALRAGGVLA
jgi:phosphatidylglycerophosphatase A